MISKILFTVITVLAVLVLLVLFGSSSETWDGTCGHKQEFGLFSFYRAGSEGGPTAECATGVLFAGLTQTVISTLSMAGSIFWVWLKFIKKSM